MKLKPQQMVFQMRAGLGSMTQQRIRLPDAKDDISSSESKGQSVRSGGKAEQTFSSKDGIAPGYRLSPDHFQKVKLMLAPDWAQKMLCIIVPNRRTHLLSSFRVFILDGKLLSRSRLVLLMH